mgnify:CR=1 FL=1
MPAASQGTLDDRPLPSLQETVTEMAVDMQKQRTGETATSAAELYRFMQVGGSDRPGLEPCLPVSKWVKCYPAWHMVCHHARRQYVLRQPTVAAVP